MRANLAPQPAPPPNLDALSASIRPIVGSNEDYLKRQSAIRALTPPSAAATNLTAADLQALYGFLLRPDPGDAGQGGQVLKNELLDALCAFNPPPSGLADTLVQMYHDRSQNVVLRDYAVQHLVSLCEQPPDSDASATEDASGASQPTRPPLPGERAGVRASVLSQVLPVLWKALGETDSSIAGTALLGLTRLADLNPNLNPTEFDRDRIAAAALDLAKENSGELTRITALQVCARLGLKESLPLAIQAAHEGETIPVRVSAVAALGALGGPEMVTFLTDISNGPEPRLKMPARQALAQIERKASQAQATKRRQ